VVSYLLRFLFCLLVMEWVLHYMYVVAIKDVGPAAWQGATPFELSMIGFWNLIVVWLKVRTQRHPHPLSGEPDVSGN
jgi:D-alanyl-lipoteichoic acid acyltransferase DltB (MBOAT superfamily)